MTVEPREGGSPALGRVGLMIPSTNTVVESDFQRELGEVASIHTARMYFPSPVTVDGERRMLDEYRPHAARDLQEIAADVVVFGCTTGGTLNGNEADDQLRSEISDIVGCPVIGVMDSLFTALAALGVARVSLFTPYPKGFHDVMIHGLSGVVDVVSDRALDIVDNATTGRLNPEQIEQEVIRTFSKDAEAVVIACSNLRAMEARPALERRLGVPVLTSNSVVVDAARAVVESGR